jgi:hypothetical protein
VFLCGTLSKIYFMENLLSITFIVAGVIWAGFLLAALFGKLLVHFWPRRTSKWPFNGVEAEAIILNIEPTDIVINDHPQVRMQMQVQPDKGRNFVVEIETNSPTAVKTGGVVRVKYNPHNYRELLLVHIA